MASVAYNQVADEFLVSESASAKSHQMYQAIDLVHLSHQSLGDRALERELLMLFNRQAQQIVELLHASVAEKDCKTKTMFNLAHTLKGSALAIGARRVAKAAEALEAATGIQIGAEPLKARVAEIDNAVDEAGRAVAGMLLG